MHIEAGNAMTQEIYVVLKIKTYKLHIISEKWKGKAELVYLSSLHHRF